MDNAEFLNYCDAMADTPRCGFVPKQIIRLLKLSGADNAVIDQWQEQPHGVYNMDKYVIRETVDAARSLIKEG